MSTSHEERLAYLADGVADNHTVTNVLQRWRARDIAAEEEDT